ncbi:alpha/beta hydrolase [Streptosporangium sp. NBC_01756]|uniref:alpha/beta hydrolase n=1 Tax=Streptosporangium sp. NBC_01756 TaxID=2975950 RepID=UPI002DD9DB8A|nr:alpha/beta hydrolase [Streptosporangium sp. NBC_01756]WSC87458.1 alpha/beta hydrolase [Streptosporangium sp. NBC_01756]
MSRELVDELRASARSRNATRPKGPDLAYVEDLTSPSGLPLRRYRPSAEPRPLMVFLHGGGWVFCDLETHDRTCRRLARECDVDVLAVDYRLAPEHPYPAAIDDAVEVLGWARPVAVAGDSAGGYLATMACLRLRDEGGPLPAVQILICPNTDLTLSLPSVTEKGTGYGLDADMVAWFAAQWTPDPERRRAASPLHHPDLSGLPAALVVTAEHDALRDEGDAYARRLADAGVRVTHRCEPGLVHGFIQGMDLTSPDAAAAHQRIFADIRGLIPRRDDPGTVAVRKRRDDPGASEPRSSVEDLAQPLQ